jgi:PleD family two-component response regulator
VAKLLRRIIGGRVERSRSAARETRLVHTNPLTPGAVVDDHPVFRAGLVAILEDLEDVEVVAQAGDGEQAIDVVASHRPDVVLMDLRMPGIGGLRATARITAHHPNTAVIVLTMTPTTIPFSPRCEPAPAATC